MRNLDITNARFVDELFQAWEQNPESVDPAWSRFFEAIANGTAGLPAAERAAGEESLAPPDTLPEGAPADSGETDPGETDPGEAGPAGSGRLRGALSTGADGASTGSRQQTRRTDGERRTYMPVVSSAVGKYAPATAPGERAHTGETTEAHQAKQVRVEMLLWAYRDVGYLYADLNPLGEYTTPELKYMFYTAEGYYQSLEHTAFGLSDDDLDREFEVGGYFSSQPMKLRNLIELFNRTYAGTMGVENVHIQNKVMRRWLIERLESPSKQKQWSDEDRRTIQRGLIRANELEQFIHTTFIGQKRFSLQGCEVLVPALRYMLSSAAAHGLQEIVLGMTHRGRLNVLTNVLDRDSADIFAQFTENYKPHEFGGSGDVKYHLGHSLDHTDEQGNRIHVSLVANPSHLEAVDPVVEGKARGIQRRRKDRHRKRVMPVLVHGDAAFSGQGVVSETLNLSRLKGYQTGGTVHIIVNNQIGFTTASRDARSTFFATDIAKGLPIPVFHVNADDPETVLQAVDLAMRYRQKTGYDAIVDIICYRRFGHNESDEPSFTHPLMYRRIEEHPSVTSIYGKTLADAGVFSEEDQETERRRYRELLKGALERARGDYEPKVNDAFQTGEWRHLQQEYSHDPVLTGVERERLERVGQLVTTVPDGFSIHSKLKRFVKDRQKALAAGAGIDWSLAETLAFGSLLLEGYPIRLSGEDSARGTFSQRHAVWWDTNSPIPRTHTPLRNLSSDQAWFSVYDSPLSEFSVLGFDYGYSLVQPNILTLWEAQFGDFVNGGQVVIDQFIAAGEKKWFRASGLVLLLPHGYEGQGPEHSSAHLERFLQLCAENNLQVVNPTTPSQYFHLLRRQLKQPFRKPLIVMTPKSLLRHKECISDLNAMVEGSFQQVLDDPEAPARVDNLLFCSGKVFYDLVAERRKLEDAGTAIVRIEQLYPRPKESLRAVARQYADAKRVAWVQEESYNRGAQAHIRPWLAALLGRDHIPYVGRRASASPATGSHAEHVEEARVLLDRAFDREADAAGEQEDSTAKITAASGGLPSQKESSSPEKARNGAEK